MHPYCPYFQEWVLDVNAHARKPSRGLCVPIDQMISRETRLQLPCNLYWIYCAVLCFGPTGHSQEPIMTPCIMPSSIMHRNELHKFGIRCEVPGAIRMPSITRNPQTREKHLPGPKQSVELPQKLTRNSNNIISSLIYLTVAGKWPAARRTGPIVVTSRSVPRRSISLARQRDLRDRTSPRLR
jgi:hypothetical protein